MTGPVFPNPLLGQFLTTKQPESAFPFFPKSKFPGNRGSLIRGAVVEQDYLPDRGLLCNQGSKAVADPTLLVPSRH